MRKSPRGLDAIIEQQVRRWTLAKQAQERAAAAAQRKRPIITVSRQFGAQGAEVARKVADALEYSFWNRELLTAIAEDSDATATILASLDEHRRDAITERVAVFGARHPLTAGDYHQELARVVHTIGEHGRAVIVGRGAQYLLPPRDTLRVRVVADHSARVHGLAKRRDITDEQAHKLVETTDADRRAFIREHYGRDCDNPAEYDLVVNSATLAPDVITATIVAACHARFG